MRLFRCQFCGNLLYFENRTCERCGHRLGYIPETGTLSALEGTGDGGWTTLAQADAPRRFCANAEHDACNWLTPPGSGDAFCLACRYNGTVPDLGDSENLTR